MSAEGTLRLFVAAEVPTAFKDRYAAIRPAFERQVPRARWSRPDGIHLTFKFLGATPTDRLGEVIDVLGGQARQTPPFELVTAGAGFFGGRVRPHVFWIALEGDLGAARRVADELEELMEKIGFDREDRPFKPHLTLARFKEGCGRVSTEDLSARATAVLSRVPFPVDQIVLLESILGPGGSRYLPHGRFSFEGGGP